MNQLLVSLGLQGWKPALGALLLPPTPLVALMLLGAAQLRRRRLLGWLLLWLGAAALWFMGTEAMATLLERSLNTPPPALSATQVAALKQQPGTAIVVLGGGRVRLALEYGVSGLKPRTAERLRYGVYLARHTGLPLAVTGGRGEHEDGPSEAEISARVAEQEFGIKLRWEERDARDTRENASRTVPLLLHDGIQHIVLVTQGYHMQRALQHFQDAAAANGGRMRITPAPMDMTPDGALRLIDWLPTLRGFEKTWLNLHELLGRLAGA
jgi:uncharacterized SAM-binding protein YcdF (DUF218 family)